MIVQSIAEVKDRMNPKKACKSDHQNQLIVSNLQLNQQSQPFILDPLSLFVLFLQLLYYGPCYLGYCDRGRPKGFGNMGYCQSCQRDATQIRKKPSVQKQTSKVRPKAVQPENLVIFVLGGPGSGKGTQCQQIADEYGFAHFSVGQMLRDELSKDSDIGNQAKMAMEEGKLVPVEVTLMMVKNAMEKSASKRLLLDGFPRAVNQAKAFEEKMCKPDMVLYLECDPKVTEERILQRGKTSGRIDDNVETTKKRLKTFEEETLSVIKYYDDPDKDVLIKVNSARASAEVFSDIASSLKELFCFESASSMVH